jgi:hypothetical protein
MKIILNRNHHFTHNSRYRVSKFIHDHMRALALAIVLLLSMIFLFEGDHKAKGAVGFHLNPTQKHEQEPVNPKLLGNYTMLVDMSSIRGSTKHPSKKIGHAYAHLAGIKPVGLRPSFVPQSHQINWAVTLAEAWDRKLARPNVSPAARKWAGKIVAKYSDSKRDTKSAEQYIAQVDNIVKQTHNEINYGALCTTFKITECTALYTTMGRIRGRSIAAYGLSENFPSDDGQFNYRMFDMILQNAGENYLHSIPSQGDDLLSTGLFQFTSLAIRRDNSGKLGGANIVDNFAGRRLPGSVVRLSTRQAHKAAFELATYNIAMTMRGLNHVEADRLAHKCPVSGLTEVIAIGHHQPAPTWVAARRWVKSGCNKPLQSFLNPHLKIYAHKSASNYTALVNNTSI